MSYLSNIFYINITFNVLTAFFLTILNSLNIVEKKTSFHNLQNRFNKLENIIIMKLENSEDNITSDFINPFQLIS